MGQPRVTTRRKYDSPLKPYDKTRLEEETRIKNQFGLRRKQELWRLHQMSNLKEDKEKLKAWEAETYAGVLVQYAKWKKL